MGGDPSSVICIRPERGWVRDSNIVAGLTSWFPAPNRDPASRIRTNVPIRTNEALHTDTLKVARTNPASSLHGFTGVCQDRLIGPGRSSAGAAGPPEWLENHARLIRANEPNSADRRTGSARTNPVPGVHGPARVHSRVGRFSRRVGARPQSTGSPPRRGLAMAAGPCMGGVRVVVLDQLSG